MKVIEKVEIRELYFPVSGYRFNAQIWRSVDGGAVFAYCGDGKYFKTRSEAEQFKKEVEND